ncbi:hypothetical protein JX265_011991 [Neoarthrinium moseri]|uniref:Uncharacterized protein n=1 Tax=Neoarthrinium moseri TaxID=1658444 RepID=A0A9P9WAY8_9PEZI|nr:hypothetical protein JX265_011991 [Neoarthrinium moseri]
MTDSDRPALRNVGYNWLFEACQTNKKRWFWFCLDKLRLFTDVRDPGPDISGRWTVHVKAIIQTVDAKYTYTLDETWGMLEGELLIKVEGPLSMGAAMFRSSAHPWFCVLFTANPSTPTCTVWSLTEAKAFMLKLKALQPGGGLTFHEEDELKFPLQFMNALRLNKGSLLVLGTLPVYK